MNTTNESSDMTDLHLEDVEDYNMDADFSSDGFPNAEQNIHENAAVSMGEMDITVPLKRRPGIVGWIIGNKWTAGLVFVIMVVFIAIIAVLAGGSSTDTKKSAINSDSGKQHEPVVVVDPSTLSQSVLDPLMSKIFTAYDNNELNKGALAEDAGDTPQRKAFYWLASQDVDKLSHAEMIQAYALAVFYYSLNAVSTPYTDTPKTWISAHLWLSDSHYCDWKGIVCNEQKHVEEIDLEDNMLSGSIPHEIAFFSSQLHTIDLTSNLIYMEDTMFRVFVPMASLETLLMDDNYLVYDKGLPGSFTSLKNLKKLRLSYNLFSGELETSHKVLGSLSKLTHLELESNYLTGTLPSVVGELKDLVYLYLRRNEMTFNLDFMKSEHISRLFAVWLDGNTITGSIPTEIGLLTELASVSMTNTSLAGPIPSEIGSLSGLRRLWLYNNALTGQIPRALNSLGKLEVLELHGNNLVGAMPQGVCRRIDESDYKYKALTSDCKSEVQCSSDCCTKCY